MKTVYPLQTKFAGGIKTVYPLQTKFAGGIIRHFEPMVNIKAHMRHDYEKSKKLDKFLLQYVQTHIWRDNSDQNKATVGITIHTSIYCEQYILLNRERHWINSYSHELPYLLNIQTYMRQDNFDQNKATIGKFFQKLPH